MKTATVLTILKHGVYAVTLNTVIALGISAFNVNSFMVNMVYSQCIGLSIWSLIDLCQAWLVRDSHRHWRRLFWIVPVGAVVGFVLGTMVADTLLNNPSLRYWSREPGKALGYLFVCMVADGVSATYFLGREQLALAREAAAHADAQAQAAQRHAAESQLKLLQTQLEPHMLFNTLANLHALIGVDPARAQHMLDHLVAYLRATLTASRATTHPLQAEFDRLQDYLALMAVRMGPRLRYTLHLPPELAGQPVPPLLLQALVENSIKHGLEPQVGGGTITVTARRMPAHIALEVADTGVGSRTDLNQAPNMAPSDTGCEADGEASSAAGGEAGSETGSFGLSQIRERLQARYGNQAALTFVAPKAGGTHAVITIPYPA